MITGELLQSLEHYIECKREHDNAFEQFEGHSWDWYGRAYIKRMEDAAQEFEVALGNYVEGKIAEKIK